MTTGGYIFISVAIFSVIFALIRTLIVEHTHIKTENEKLKKWENELKRKEEELKELQNYLSVIQVSQIKAASSFSAKLVARVSEAVSKGAHKKIFRNTPVFEVLENPDLDSKSRLFSSIPLPIRYDAPPYVSWDIDSSSSKYTVTLSSCTCKDFQIRKKPCKHMIRLGLELGFLQFADDSQIIKKVIELEDWQAALEKEDARIKKQGNMVDEKCRKRERECIAVLQKNLKTSYKHLSDSDIANIISGFSDVFDEEIIYHLDFKDHPAHFTAQEIREYYKDRNQALYSRVYMAEAEAKYFKKQIRDLQKRSKEC